MRWFLCENLGSEELQPGEGPSRTSWGLERPHFWPPIVLEVVTTPALRLRAQPSSRDTDTNPHHLHWQHLRYNHPVRARPTF